MDVRTRIVISKNRSLILTSTNHDFLRFFQECSKANLCPPLRVLEGALSRLASVMAAYVCTRARKRAVQDILVCACLCLRVRARAAQSDKLEMHRGEYAHSAEVGEVAEVAQEHLPHSGRRGELLRTVKNMCRSGGGCIKAHDVR